MPDLNLQQIKEQLARYRFTGVPGLLNACLRAEEYVDNPAFWLISMTMEAPDSETGAHSTTILKYYMAKNKSDYAEVNQAVRDLTLALFEHEAKEGTWLEDIHLMDLIQVISLDQ